MPFYGRGGTTPDTAFGVTTGVGTDNQRATVYNPMPVNAWGFRMLGWYAVWASDPGTSSVRMAVWNADESNDAGDLQAYTAAFNVTAEGSFAGDASQFTQNFVNSKQPDNPVETSVMLWSGRAYAVGQVHTGQRLLIQQANAADVTYTNEQLYRRGVGTNNPTDPFSATAVSIEGMQTVAIEYETNVAPNTPSTGLAPTGNINTLTPTFTSTFVDANSARGDSISQSQIEVRQGSTTGTVRWNPVIDSATGGVYAGTTLVAGVTYYWKIRHYDQFGEASGWSAWQSFTVNSGGTVGTISIVGKQDTIQPGPFVASWTHGGGLSTNQVELTLKSPGGSVLRGPTTIANTTAPGGNISIPWSTLASAGWADLAWGTPYVASLRARDTASLYSNPKTSAFTTNYYPTVPSNLSPSNSQVVSSFPLLTCIATDQDDTLLTGLAVTARIKNNAGAVLFSHGMTYNPSLSRWEYQTTGTDLATFATFKWDAQATDGTLTSAFSPEAIFVYGQGPAVTGTFPTAASTITTNTPTFTWTTTGQVSFRFKLFKTSDNSLVHDSLSVVSAVSSYTIPTGFIFNNGNYYYTVDVTNSVPLTGTSAAIQFFVVYTALDPVAISVSPVAISGDNFLSANLISWVPAAEPPLKFLEYTLWRRDTATDMTIILARINNVAQFSFIDYYPRSGTTYEYGIAKTVYQGSNEATQSDKSYATSVIVLRSPVLLAVDDPESLRATLRLEKDGATLDYVDSVAYVSTWADVEPTALVDPLDYRVFTGSFDLPQYATDNVSSQATVDNVRAIRATKGTCCYRDDRGDIVFGNLKLKETHHRLFAWEDAITLTETNFKIGVK